jgi:RNA polymerase sigma-70 factor (ECF subfamily)
LLSREGGLKQEEIAQRLGISLSAVKKHMVDALRFLREEISGKYGSLAIALFVLFDLKFPGV